jgi:hypothetical protein
MEDAFNGIFCTRKVHFTVENLPLPEFIDPVFAKTSPKRLFSMTENERFGLVFAKTGSINSGTGIQCPTSVANPGEI